MLSKYYPSVLLMHLTQPKPELLLWAGDRKTMKGSLALFPFWLLLPSWAPQPLNICCYFFFKTMKYKIQCKWCDIKCKPQHNRDRKLKIRCLMTKNNWVKFPLITFNNSVRTVSLGRSSIQKFRGLQCFKCWHCSDVSQLPYWSFV